MGKERLSVILPVYNEEKVLEDSVSRIKRALEKTGRDFEIVISEDGSTDETHNIAKSLESKNIIALHNSTRMGKGAAIKTAISHASGNIIIFMDVDLASNPEYVKQLVKFLESGAAIVIGSRYHKDSKTKRTPVRHFASKSFNFLVRTMLGSKLSDHQCGFKAFRKDLLLPVIDEVEDGKWFWDTELLVRAQRKGLNIVEIPIEWTEDQDSKFRIFGDTCHMAYSLLSFKLKNG